MRRFNVTGPCVSSEDYMVDTSSKIDKIMEMVEDRQYFTINKARQYGKTTTFALLRNRMQSDYIVASISFEGLGEKTFASTETFCHTFLDIVQEALEFTEAATE